MRRLLGIVVLAGLGLLAMPVVASAAPSATDGTTRAVVKPAGISLRYPSAWIVAEQTKEALAAQVEALAATDPDLAAQLAQTDLQTAKFRAIDPAAGAGEVRSGVRVQVVNSPAPKNLATFTKEATRTYEAAGDTVLGTDGVEIGGATAYRIDLSVPIATSGATPTVARISQRAAPRRSEASPVTVSAPDTAAGAAQIDAILGSVRRR